MYRYINGIISSLECRLLCIGGTENHLHLLVSMSKNIKIVDLMEDMKKDSSKWMKTQGSQYAGFYWQEGYAAFSIGESGVPSLRNYIGRQKQHHRTVTFEEELLMFLRKYNIPFDERYMWR